MRIQSLAAAANLVKAETGRPKKSLTFAYFGLLVFLIIYCGRPNDWIPGMALFPFARISAAVALFGLGLAILGSGRSILKFPREVHLLILLFFQLCLSVPFAIWRAGAFEKVFTEFSKVIPIFILIFVTATTVARLRVLVVVQTACVAVMAFLALSGFSRSMSLSNRSDVQRLGGAVGGIFGNPNDFAWALAMTFPFAFALMLSAKNLVARTFWAVTTIAMAVAVMQTMSRGGLIALAVSATVTIWQYGVTGKRRYLLALAAVGAATLFLVAAPEGYLRRVASAVDWSKDETGSASGRMQLLKISVATTLQNPLFGIGPGNFDIVSGSWHGTHNTFTQFSSEAGVPAMLLYIALLWSSFKKLKKIRTVTSETDERWILAGGMQAALAGLVVGGLFGMAAYLFSTYFLIAFACTLHKLTIGAAGEDESISTRAKKVAEPRGWTSGETVSTTPVAPTDVRRHWSPPLGHRRHGRLEK